MVELDSEGYKCTKTVKKEDVARMERMLEMGKTCNLAGSRVVSGTNLESTGTSPQTDQLSSSTT